MSSLLGGSKVATPQPVPSYLPTNIYSSSGAASMNFTSAEFEFKTSLDVTDPNNPFFIANILQARLDAAVLSVVGNSITVSSGILGIVSSSLSVIKETLGFIPSTWGLIEKPLQLDVSLTTFGITLFNDGLKYSPGADILGQEAKFVKMWESVKGQLLSKGSLGSNYEDLIAQIAKAKSILEPLTQFYKN